jgi:opacity protein-like surface antigen
MKKSLFIVALIMLFAVPTVLAQQYKYEVGPTLGMTGYLGEDNNGNLFKHPSFTVGGIFRYVHNSRWAFKANLNYANLRGNSMYDETWYPDGLNYTNSSNLIDLGLTAEFNFLNYGRGPAYKKYKPISPYMVAGVGFVFAINNGHNQASFTVPIGIGVKYKLKDRVNLGFEFTMRKEFSDRIDGHSDLFGIKHSFAKNTDWYSFAMFTASFEFGKRCIKCNYIE